MATNKGDRTAAQEMSLASDASIRYIFLREGHRYHIKHQVSRIPASELGTTSVCVGNTSYNLHEESKRTLCIPLEGLYYYAFTSVSRIAISNYLYFSRCNE